jgi:hypothetical protein
MQISQVKRMLTAIFDARGIIHHKFVLEKKKKQTVNGTFCKEVIKRLIMLDGGERPWREADYSPTTSAEVEKTWVSAFTSHTCS